MNHCAVGSPIAFSQESMCSWGGKECFFLIPGKSDVWVLLLILECLFVGQVGNTVSSIRRNSKHCPCSTVLLNCRVFSPVIKQCVITHSYKQNAQKLCRSCLRCDVFDQCLILQRFLDLLFKSNIFIPLADGLNFFLFHTVYKKKKTTFIHCIFRFKVSKRRNLERHPQSLWTQWLALVLCLWIKPPAVPLCPQTFHVSTSLKDFQTSALIMKRSLPGLKQPSQSLKMRKPTSVKWEKLQR